ncbi:hypothetical protein NSK_006191 [Nannochloropsis salina CCMP1776]|uniref:Uncharacterized protein n=1 Tax=Nannochloropsis salina CCMP1776 TaxID=1027361 RepID=A0A4D9CY52_9STRA|nr:hypothetical protein NSK_006191 [Nannochloropsis salina CCMP1776]|eukprot:TFJ82513.1 hypothetical protein NSK_006191 [Nannochloropsis salina CCMP1776]
MSFSAERGEWRLAHHFGIREVGREGQRRREGNVVTNGVFGALAKNNGGIAHIHTAHLALLPQRIRLLSTHASHPSLLAAATAALSPALRHGLGQDSTLTDLQWLSHWSQVTFTQLFHALRREEGGKEGASLPGWRRSWKRRHKRRRAMQVQILPDYAGRGGGGGRGAKARFLCPLSPRSNHHPPDELATGKREVDRTQEEGKRGTKKEGKEEGEGRHDNRGRGGFGVRVGWSHM